MKTSFSLLFLIKDFFRKLIDTYTFILNQLNCTFLTGRRRTISFSFRRCLSNSKPQWFLKLAERSIQCAVLEQKSYGDSKVAACLENIWKLCVPLPIISTIQLYVFTTYANRKPSKGAPQSAKMEYHSVVICKSFPTTVLLIALLAEVKGHFCKPTNLPHHQIGPFCKRWIIAKITALHTTWQ